MAKKRKGEPLPTQVIGPCELTEGRDVCEALETERAAWKKAFMRQCVDRFLAWPLPQSVCSDLCATDSNYKFPRSGTNLLTANEARQMLEHVLGFKP